MDEQTKQKCTGLQVKLVGYLKQHGWVQRTVGIWTHQRPRKTVNGKQEDDGNDVVNFQICDQPDVHYFGRVYVNKDGEYSTDPKEFDDNITAYIKHVTELVEAAEITGVPLPGQKKIDEQTREPEQTPEPKPEPKATPNTESKPVTSTATPVESAPKDAPKDPKPNDVLPPQQRERVNQEIEKIKADKAAIEAAEKAHAAHQTPPAKETVWTPTQLTAVPEKVAMGTLPESGVLVVVKDGKVVVTLLKPGVPVEIDVR